MTSPTAPCHSPPVLNTRYPFTSPEKYLSPLVLPLSPPSSADIALLVFLLLPPCPNPAPVPVPVPIPTPAPSLKSVPSFNLSLRRLSSAATIPLTNGATSSTITPTVRSKTDGSSWPDRLGLSDAAMGSNARLRSVRSRPRGAASVVRTFLIACFSVMGGGGGERQLRARVLTAVDVVRARGQ